MLDLLDAVQKAGVNLLLNVLELSSPLGVGLVAGLNSLLSDLRSVLELVLGEPSGLFEEGVIDVGLHAIDGDLGGGGDDVGGVDSSEGNSVDGVWAGD